MKIYDVNMSTNLTTIKKIYGYYLNLRIYNITLADLRNAAVVREDLVKLMLMDVGYNQVVGWDSTKLR